MRAGPVLSLIICSRNDQFQGDSRWRLQTVLNYTAAAAREVGRADAVELVVVDWGSDEPLVDAVALTPDAKPLVTFVYVPTALARATQGDSPFSEVHALNAAVRRARGTYIGRIDQDTLAGTRFLRTFFDLYEGRRSLAVPLEKALLFASRRSIPFRFADRTPSLWAVDRFVRWLGPRLKVWNFMAHRPELFWCSWVGIWLLHRDLWHACGGFDESYIYRNEMEVDMAQRLMRRYEMVNFGEVVDFDFYHLNHVLPFADQGTFRQLNPKRGREVDPDYVPDVFRPNDDTWGLIEHDLEQQPGIRAPTLRERASWLEWPHFISTLGASGFHFAIDLVLKAVAPSLGRRLAARRARAFASE